MHVDVVDVAIPINATTLELRVALGTHRQNLDLFDYVSAFAAWAQAFTEVVLQVDTPAVAQRDNIAARYPITIVQLPHGFDPLDITTAEAILLGRRKVECAEEVQRAAVGGHR